MYWRTVVGPASGTLLAAIALTGACGGGGGEAPVDGATDGAFVDGVDGGGAVDGGTLLDGAADAWPSADAAMDGSSAPDGGDTDASGTDAGDTDAGPAVPCNTCHGDSTSDAPPAGTDGATATSARGVGAHRSHLIASPDWHRVLVCTDCHIVPGHYLDPGHMDTPLPAELTFSPLASRDGATPGFDGVTCSGVYCHGDTLIAGGSLTAPAWTTVDGTQAACGTCHGLPPDAPHLVMDRCGVCHPTIDASTFLTPDLHVDGNVQLSIPTDCVTCHGSGTDPSPPEDLLGNTATTERGVGAHQSHLGPSTWRAPIACEACHVVPRGLFDRDHIDTPRPAELTWGPLARTDGTAPSFDGMTCAGVYCHGETLLPGGTLTVPEWTRVDGTQAACGTCHGVPPGGTHPTSTDCATCHPTMDASGAIIAPDRHVDGRVDVVSLSCTSCHGSGTDPAPPADTSGGTSTTLRGVGAHASHLATSTWRASIACDACHVVPSAVGAAGHTDSSLPAELTWGPMAHTDGATPAFDGTTCSGVYCHGETLLPGGSITTPEWTRVDGSQAACGSCHGLPPGGTHPTSTDCATCHPTMDATGTIIDPDRHVDGTVDLVSLTCTTCHGSGTNPAPPTDTMGLSGTGRRGVGAHRRHLRASTWRAPIACDQCHVVPTAIADPGHNDTPLPAEMTWGALATADAASPSFDGTTCAGVYCHGETLLPGGSITAPVWTTVDGTQAACGTCHSLPPGGTHPMSTACSTCHPTIDASGAITDPGRHVDGTVDLVTPACTACHGSGGVAAPPVDTTGGSATSSRGVGAHRSHLGASTWRAPITCDQCHVVPASATATGHIDTPLPAEMTWGALATADAASPSFDGRSCAGVYCHGETLLPGGTITTPDWTTVDGSQSACGTCHSLPPGGTHPASTACATCHPTIDGSGTITDPARHIDGVVDVVTLTCTSCHGSGSEPAPPLDTTGGSATTRRGVGAHRSHIGSSTWRAPITCDQCHVVPGSVGAAGHIDTALPAELTWGALATADAAAPAFDGTSCSGVYCHGETLLPGGSNTTPDWTTVDGSQATCGTCHGLPPGGTHPVSTACSNCHPTIDAAGAITDPGRHIDGTVDLVTPSCTGCHGSGSEPAPPLDTTGGGSTSLRGVGAHRSHLATSGWRAPITCDECHVVPASATDTGHIDTALPAELTWGALATADAAAPAFDGTSCSGVYCHGETLLPGGSNTTPDWTTVDGSQATCGTCHGLPPGGTHPVSTACSNCHPTIDAAGAITDPGRHIDGTVDLVTPSCTGCHGSGSEPAPPLDTTGGGSTSLRGVGAHRSHLATSGWRAPITCDECHVVPASATDTGHIDTALPAELTWGALATADAAAPAFDGTSCSGVYCHGETLLPGGSNTTPDWTTVDGSQATCGTCHGTPPGGTHPPISDCYVCHGTVIDSSLSFVNPSLHINGNVEVERTCGGCHMVPANTGAHYAHFDGGSPSAPRPQDGVYGGLETAADLVTGGASYFFGCGHCHPLDPARHMDGSTQVEVQNALAPASSLKARSPSATYDSGTGTCTNVYCHSSSVESPAYATTPAWTTGTIASPRCDACHPAPGGGHLRHTDDALTSPWNTLNRDYPCTTCHVSVVSQDAGPDGYVIFDATLHVNGLVDWRLDGSDPRLDGTESYSIASGTAMPSDGATSRTYGTCGDVYCHSTAQSTTDGVGPPDAYTTVTWGAGTTCEGCHNPPGDDVREHSMGLTSGSHASHITSELTNPDRPFQCLRCHNWAGVSWASPGAGCRTFSCHSSTMEQSWHINGLVDIAIAPQTVGAAMVYSGTPSPGDGWGSCNDSYCHSDGTAPRTDVIGATTTPVWGSPGPLACNACHGNTIYPPPLDGMPAYPNGSPKENSHIEHVVTQGIGCGTCHSRTTSDGLTVLPRAPHATQLYGSAYHLFASGDYMGTPVAFRYFTARPSSPGGCDTISCHSDGGGYRPWGGP